LIGQVLFLMIICTSSNAGAQKQHYLGFANVRLSKRCTILPIHFKLIKFLSINQCTLRIQRALPAYAVYFHMVRGTRRTRGALSGL
jgi:hypothetical protein